jgi:hypothetical protein
MLKDPAKLMCVSFSVNMILELTIRQDNGANTVKKKLHPLIDNLQPLCIKRVNFLDEPRTLIVPKNNNSAMLAQ